MVQIYTLFTNIQLFYNVKTNYTLIKNNINTLLIDLKHFMKKIKSILLRNIGNKINLTEKYWK